MPAQPQSPPPASRGDADAKPPGTAYRVVLGLAAFVIIVTGMRAAAPLIVPFLLALFVAILSAMPLAWLRAHGVPRWLTLPAALCALTLGTVLLSGLVAGAVNRFVQDWPEVYEPRAQQLAGNWNAKIETRIKQHAWMSELRIEDLRELWSGWANPDALMDHFLAAMRATGGILSQGLMILITAIFLLAEGAALPDKLRMISPQAEQQMDNLGRIVSEIHRYLAIKTWTSLMTGIPISVGLWLLGVEFAMLWGLLAFLLNFVPNIGSILAAVPALVMAVLQPEADLGVSLAAAVLYVVVNGVIGWWIEPKWMGRGLGLSTLVVFLSLVFWGWILGPIGMLISVPLTMAVKIVLESSPETRWLAILMGSGAIVVPARPGFAVPRARNAIRKQV